MLLCHLCLVRSTQSRQKHELDRPCFSMRPGGKQCPYRSECRTCLNDMRHKPCKCGDKPSQQEMGLSIPTFDQQFDQHLGRTLPMLETFHARLQQARLADPNHGGQYHTRCPNRPHACVFLSWTSRGSTQPSLTVKYFGT